MGRKKKEIEPIELTEPMNDFDIYGPAPEITFDFIPPVNTYDEVIEEYNIIDNYIIDFFEKLKRPKRACDGFIWRRRLMPDEVMELVNLYNIKFGTDEKYCKTCSSKLTILYDKLFDEYKKILD